MTGRDEGTSLFVTVMMTGRDEGTSLFVTAFGRKADVAVLMFCFDLVSFCFVFRSLSLVAAEYSGGTAQ